MNDKMRMRYSSSVQVALIFLIGFGGLVGHYLAGNSAMGVDRTLLNPFALNHVLESHVPAGSLICSGGPSYERSLLEFSFPQYNWVFVPVDETDADVTKSANRFILLSDRIFIDEPNQLSQAEALFGAQSADQVVKQGAYALYRVW
ncbi:MAG: hypothetical protein ACFCU1_04855 [Sumerlaeia bacterium]